MSGKSFLSRPEAKSFESLFNEVIRTGRCMKCGACVATCPYKVLTIDNKAEMPILVKECVSCQVCYYQCPRVEFPVDKVEKYVFEKSFEQKKKLGTYTSINTGRSKNDEILSKCEDGGVISSLVTYALNTKKADSAILTRSHKLLPWKANPVVVTTQEEVTKNAGSKYSISPTMMGLCRAAEDYRMKKIVFVGLPCQIQALRRMQTTPLKAPSNMAEQVTLVISLVCMESYVYDEFLYSLFIQKGIDPTTVSKFSIKRGKFKIYVEGEGAVSLPLKEIKPLMNSGCQICSDYSGEYADISVGAVGSEIGWSTVLTRTKKGEEFLKEAVKEGYIELRPLREEGPNFEFLLKEADRKKQRAVRNQTTPVQ